MPSFDGGPQEDPNWNEPEEKTEPKFMIKYDFEDLDVTLYLALREIMGLDYKSTTQAEQIKIKQRAMNALTAFQLSRGPLPEWAANWNWNRSLVEGAQLMTKDGRRMGNAHIVKKEFRGKGEIIDSIVYVCITDAGSTFTLSEKEIHNAFWIGEFLSKPERIIKDFDREGYFAKDPE